jgi:hypothetical protein
MKLLGKYIMELVKDEGKMETEISLSSVDRMYYAVCHKSADGKYLFFIIFETFF